MSAAQLSPRVSIVIPVYGGEDSIGPLTERLIEILPEKLGTLQIVLVNDCSPDGSAAVCRSLRERFTEIVTYVELARNFGEHNAVMAGLHHARGEHIVIMDDDFQNPPEEVVRLVETAREGGHDVVYTRYPRKQHSLFRNLGSRVHNYMASWMLDKPKDLYLSSFKCISRFAAREITKYSGPYPYVDGLLLRCTRRIGVVEVRHDARRDGRSGYTLRKLLRLWLNMFLNFSVIPLRVSSVLGIGMVVLGALLGTAVTVEKILFPEHNVGWPSLIFTIVTFSGVQLLILGLLGEYLGHLFLSVNQTPQYVVRHVESGTVSPLEEEARGEEKT